MSQKEILKHQIEEERGRLNGLLAEGKNMEEVYEQSLILDRLIEEYMNL